MRWSLWNDLFHADSFGRSDNEGYWQLCTSISDTNDFLKNFTKSRKFSSTHIHIAEDDKKSRLHIMGDRIFPESDEHLSTLLFLALVQLFNHYYDVFFRSCGKRFWAWKRKFFYRNNGWIVNKFKILRGNMQCFWSILKMFNLRCYKFQAFTSFVCSNIKAERDYYIISKPC